MVEYFTIFGERCSGTNFLEKSIMKNFYLNLTWDYGWKHLWRFHNFKNSSLEDATIFIGIVRNPTSWIDSFFKNPHHIPQNKKINIKSFIEGEFTSIHQNKLIEKYNNIFELRRIKNERLMNQMPKLVKNYILIRYEDLNNDFDNVLTNIAKKFNLVFREKTIYRPLNYKGNEKAQLYSPKKVELSKDICQKIIDSVDKDQERALGYGDIFQI